MSLETYKNKRRFDKTPEPIGGKSASDKLLFVIQKHHASHLHYDFRLEVRGTLKSWAVPKGPSLNPEQKRLSQLVEDHPFDYKDFEGIIPDGNYGAGTVIIWDQGTYEPKYTTGDKEQDEKLMLKQFFSGKIHIVMHGKKVKGEFTLIKTPARGLNAWLLSKVKDVHAKSDIDITQRDQSVVSGMTIEEMQENSGVATWHSNRSASSSTSAKRGKRRSGEKKNNGIIIEAPSKQNYEQIVEFIKREFKKVKQSDMPSGLLPMEATLVEEPFDDPDFQYEIKWDGYRCLSYVNNGLVTLRSKSDLSFNKKYPLIVEALQRWGINVVVDGEVVVLNEEGKSDFNALQNYSRTQQGNLFYHVFDILWLDGISLMNEPLSRRQEILKRLVPENTIIRFSGYVDEKGEDFFELIKKNGLEGMVAKRKDSRYFAHTRSSDWLKLPVEEIKEYVIVGYTESEHGRPFARLMIGNYREDGKLYYVHHTGGGISDQLMNSTYQLLKELKTKRKPVANEAEEDTPIHWVKPELVGRFKQKAHERTKAGKIRHPVIFLGLREDVLPEQVIEGKEIKSGQIKTVTTKKRTKKTAKRKHASKFDQVGVWRSLHPGKEIEQQETITVEGKDIILINYEQDYWQGITKLQLIMYYQSISDYILPYLKDRPLGLNVIERWAGEKDARFVRNMKGYYPDWVNIFTTDRRHAVEGKTEDIDWVVCNDMATLIYLLNLGAVDLHPWSAAVKHHETPDYIVIDLDPDDSNEKDKTANTRNFKNVINVAQEAYDFLSGLGISSFVKTSGKTGMHILLPCKGITYADCKMLAQMICQEIHERTSNISTTNTSVHTRGGKVYIDARQNVYGDRLVAPYCVRAYKQPYVSTPLSWSEIDVKLDRHAFKMDTMKQRLDEKGDLFDGLFEVNVQKINTDILKQLYVESAFK